MGVPSAVGPLAAGVILDNYNPNLVWYAAGGLAAVAALGFLVLNSAAGARLATMEVQAEAVSD